MEIRKIRSGDEKDVSELLSALKKEGHDLSVYRAFDAFQEDVKTSVWIGVWDEKLVGVYRAAMDSNTPHKCSLCIGFVSGYQGKGLAKKMFDLGVPLLQQKGVEVIHAWIYSNNAPSMAFAKKIGFEENGRVPIHHYENGQRVDDLLYAYYL